MSVLTKLKRHPNDWTTASRNRTRSAGRRPNRQYKPIDDWCNTTWASDPEQKRGGGDEWVRALDWRPGGPGFESRCGNFASELWQFRLPRFASVFRRRHIKAFGPFYMVYIPGEIKYTTSLHWKCVTCRGLHILTKYGLFGVYITKNMAEW